MTLASELVPTAPARRGISSDSRWSLVPQHLKACYRKEERCPNFVLGADAGRRRKRKNQSRGGCR